MLEAQSGRNLVEIRFFFFFFFETPPVICNYANEANPFCWRGSGLKGDVLSNILLGIVLNYTSRKEESLSLRRPFGPDQLTRGDLSLRRLE